MKMRPEFAENDWVTLTIGKVSGKGFVREIYFDKKINEYKCTFYHEEKPYSDHFRVFRDVPCKYCTFIETSNSYDRRVNPELNLSQPFNESPEFRRSSQGFSPDEWKHYLEQDL